MNQNARVLYTAKVRTIGGPKSSISRSYDGVLDIRFSPRGTSLIGTNPEQLFAASWSACLLCALTADARKRNISLPVDVRIEAEVDLCEGAESHFLQARFRICIPDLERGVARNLVNAAFESCPYSKAARGNVDIDIDLSAEA